MWPAKSRWLLAISDAATRQLESVGRELRSWPLLPAEMTTWVDRVNALDATRVGFPEVLTGRPRDAWHEGLRAARSG